MRGLSFLWALHIAGVSSSKLMPLKIWELSQASFEPQTRVYGGTEGKEGEYPFMIFTLFKNQNGSISTCSASLLTLDWVLTAAHCITSRDIILIGGKLNLINYVEERLKTDWNNSVDDKNLGVEERRAQAVHIHPQFVHTEELLLHDIALIKVATPFPVAENIKTIPLHLEKIYDCEICTILGWGKTRTHSKYRLHAVREKEISTTDIGCKYETSHPIICLKPDKLSGICVGDSGSPLVCNGKIYGVASYILTNSSTCGDSLEEYYVELSQEKDWIRSVLNTGSIPFEMELYRAFTFVLTTLWVSSNIFY